MNVFELYLDGAINADQLRNQVREPSTPVGNDSVLSNPGPTTPQTNAMWVDGPADERRLTTYDQRIDSEVHARNNGANPFSAVMLDPVSDQRQADLSAGRTVPNAFANVYLEPYDPVRDRQQFDITNQSGRFEVERQQQSQNAFASVPTPSVSNPTTNVGGNVGGNNPTSDQRDYTDNVTRVANDQRDYVNHETYFNPANQRPLW